MLHKHCYGSIRYSSQSRHWWSRSGFFPLLTQTLTTKLRCACNQMQQSLDKTNKKFSCAALLDWGPWSLVVRQQLHLGEQHFQTQRYLSIVVWLLRYGYGFSYIFIAPKDHGRYMLRYGLPCHAPLVASLIPSDYTDTTTSSSFPPYVNIANPFRFSIFKVRLRKLLCLR